MWKSKWWVGLLLIMLGALMLLNNLGLTTVKIGFLIRTYWPLALVIWGLNNLATSKGRGSNLLSGVLLLLIGMVLLGNNLGVLHFDTSIIWKLFWPLVLILAGITLLKGPITGGKSNTAFMGAVERTKGNWKLESGEYRAVLGGVELDLRRAEIEEKEYRLNLIALLGGIEITVPSDLTVICEGTAVLGGVEFLGEGSGGIFGSISTRQEGTTPGGGAVLYLYGRAVLGGIEVTVKD